MTRATCFSMLALSVAIWNFVQHRDISANMYIAAFMVIQGVRYIPDEIPSKHWDRVALLCTILSVAICLFSVYGLSEGFQWGRPKSW
jgi:hypothetical protein